MSGFTISSTFPIAGLQYLLRYQASVHVLLVVVIDKWRCIDKNEWCISDEVFYGPQLSHFSLKNFLAEVGFEPGSPSWEAGALSITPRADMHLYIDCVFIEGSK